jgi:hypothetical protein
MKARHGVAVMVAAAAGLVVAVVGMTLLWPSPSSLVVTLISNHTY